MTASFAASSGDGCRDGGGSYSLSLLPGTTLRKTPFAFSATSLAAPVAASPTAAPVSLTAVPAWLAADLDAILAPGLLELCDRRGIQLISPKDYPD